MNSPAPPPPDSVDAASPNVRLVHGVVWLDRSVAVLDSGAEVSLSRQESGLVAYLAARAGTDVPRDELLKEVWGHVKLTATRSVDMAVARLRKKLEPDPRVPVHLLTSRGGGYRWVAAAPAAPAGLAPPAPRTDLSPPGRRAALLGRATLLDALATQLGVETPAPLILTGPPGVGKSAVATALAWRLLDLGLLAGLGLVHVDCSHAADPDALLSQIAQALGTETTRIRAADDLVGNLGNVLAARPGTLLVLDDADPAAAVIGPVLHSLLSAAPHTRAVVTSRTRPEVHGATVHLVPPLDDETGGALLAARANALRADAVPHSAVDLAEAVAAALDGLPLAIELAAALLRGIGLDGLWRRVQTAGVGLFSADASRPVRHRSLQAAVAWSTDGLPADTAAALAALAVFHQGFDLAAAEAVLGPEAPDQLLRLVDRSLVRVEGRVGRYSTLRAVMAHCAGPDHDALQDAARERHAAHYAHRCVQARLQLDDTTGQSARAWLHRERGNLEHALAHALEQGQVAHAGQLALALDRLAALHGTPQVRVRMLDRAVALCATSDAHAALEVTLRLAKARAHSAQGDADAILVEVEALRTAAAATPSDRVEAELVVAAHHRNHGDLRASRARAEAAEALATQHGLDGLAACAHAEVLLLGQFLGATAVAPEDAERTFRAAAAARRRAGDNASAVRVLVRLGVYQHNAGHVARAQATRRDALALASQLPHRRLKAMVASHIATGQAQLGHHQDAIALYEEALDAMAVQGDTLLSLTTRHYRAESLVALGKLDEAVAELAAVRRECELRGWDRHLAHALEILSLAHMLAGAPAEAEQAATLGLALAEASGDHVMRLDLAGSAALARLEQGDARGADRILVEAAERAPLAEAPVHVAMLAVWRATIAHVRNRPDEREVHVAEARRRVAGIDSPLGEVIRRCTEALTEGAPMPVSALGDLPAQALVTSQAVARALGGAP